MNNALAAAFLKAQKEFSPALKLNENKHLGNRYANLASCVDAVIDALNNNGFYLMQIPHDAEGGVKIETLFCHESGESINGGTLFVPVSKPDAQGYGSALTYARRYGLMAACGIAPEDDDGNAASKPQKGKQGAGQIKPTDGAKEALTKEEQQSAELLAQSIIDMLADGLDDEASLALYNKHNSQEFQVYVWTFLDTGMRRRLKSAYANIPKDMPK